MTLPKTMSIDELRRKNEATKAAQKQTSSPAPTPTETGR